MTGSQDLDLQQHCAHLTELTKEPFRQYARDVRRNVQNTQRAASSVGHNLQSPYDAPRYALHATCNSHDATRASTGAARVGGHRNEAELYRLDAASARMIRTCASVFMSITQTTGGGICRHCAFD